MSSETDLVVNAMGVARGYPTFDPECPQTWFLQLENMLKLRGLTKRGTWFQHAVVALPGNVVSQFKDITSKPPENNSHDRLKKAVISRLPVSREKRLHQLLSQVELGDRTPSKLLRRMRFLDSGYELKDEILKELWVNCLSVNMVPFLITSPYQDDLDKLAEVADRIHNRHDRPSVSGVKTSASAVTTPQQLEAIIDRLEKLGYVYLEWRGTARWLISTALIGTVLK